VATSFALSVVRPQSCGIGGGGFMVIALPDDPRNPDAGAVLTTFSYREKAPGAVSADYFERLESATASRWSGHAVGVPGTVAGLLTALERYGTLDRQTVMAPAIRLAEEGFTVDEAMLTAIESAITWYQEDESRKQLFPFVWTRYCREGEAQQGDVIRNPEQAAALRLIADEGAAVFYSGAIADAILRTVQTAGGVMEISDLVAFDVRERAPLLAEFRGQTIATMPPPSSGGIALLQVLGILSEYEVATESDLASLDQNSPEYLHPVVEAIKHAFADRARWLGDDAMADVPIDALLGEEYLRERAMMILPGKTLKSSEYGVATLPPDDHGTSHLSVVDARGGAVACTETINLGFGSRLVVDGYGFALNNEMDDFTTVEGQANAFGLHQSSANLPAPGKRPLSSMTPTIVLDEDGQVTLVAGGSGGPRIITAVLQTLLNVMLFDMTATEAVSRPRVHHQWRPNVLQVEPAMDPENAAQMGSDMGDVQRAMREFPISNARKRQLTAWGHMWGVMSDYGVVQLIRRAADGGYDAASDPRKGGRPAGQ
jgi:gamma-glutamyltranspeptidase/glutathione hydrolase